jgi:hypothetical protein
MYGKKSIQISGLLENPKTLMETEPNDPSSEWTCCLILFMPFVK